ncbi:MAG: SH3 domain-containing protein [Anaerolineales bacterium]|jgi:uncharacterized protein YgiM (DUF1202 family)
MKFLLLSCMCIVCLAACSSPATGTATPTPTGLPNPTLAQLPTSTATLTPTLTPAGLKYCVTTNLLNLRSGPGIQYTIVTIEGQGTCGQAIARSDDSTWVYLVTGKYTGWAYVKYLTGQGDISKLPTLKELTLTPHAPSQPPGASPTITP